LNIKENCPTCNEPTRYVIGFFDGLKLNGRIYDCNNLSCHIKRENIEKALAIEEERQTNIIENAKSGISMERVKMQRRELLITTFGMAKRLGISPSDYSNYEQYREAVPVEMVERIFEVFREHDEEFTQEEINLIRKGREEALRGETVLLRSL